VVTNDLPIALILEKHGGANVILIGGILRRRFHRTVITSSGCSEMLAGLTIDKAFMGVNSLSLDKGATTPDINQAETKKFMIRMAMKVILLCDSSKFSRSSFAQFATLEQIDAIVTERIEDRERQKLEDQGIEIIIAE
jgi:DeoR family fructose operon transcriptional repressor